MQNVLQKSFFYMYRFPDLKMIKYWEGKFMFAISFLFQQGPYLLISLYYFQICIIILELCIAFKNGETGATHCIHLFHSVVSAK